MGWQCSSVQNMLKKHANKYSKRTCDTWYEYIHNKKLQYNIVDINYEAKLEKIS